MCACDVDDVDAVTRLVERIDGVDGLVAYKLGSLLTLRLGLAGVATAFRKVTRKPLLYDHQKAGLDIPSMGREFVAACRDAGVDALILFPLGGPSAVDAFVGETVQAGLRAIVGGALPLPDFLIRGGGYVSPSALARITERAYAIGARDFIVPATDIPTLQRQARFLTVRGGGRLFLPGIGPLGGEITQAFAATRGIASYAIVGRAIYAASDPREAALRLAGEALAVA